MKYLKLILNFFFFGLFFSFTFCYFAGWDTNAFVTFIFIGPLMVLFLAIILGNLKVLSFNGKFEVISIRLENLFKKSSLSSPLLFWLYLILILLPIISFRLSYYFIERNSEIKIWWWLYQNRYLSLVYGTGLVAFILALIGLGKIGKKILRRNKLKKKATDKK